LTLAQAEANREYTDKIAREDQDLENRDRMSSAAATELATRHAPSSVSNTEVYAPTNF
jgi:hypothetical protein